MWESPQPTIMIRFTDRHSLWFRSRRTRMSSVSNSEWISSGKLFTCAIMFLASCSTFAPLLLATGCWALAVGFSLLTGGVVKAVDECDQHLCHALRFDS